MSEKTKEVQKFAEFTQCVCLVKLSINIQEYFQLAEYEHRLGWQVGASLWFSAT